MDDSIGVVKVGTILATRGHEFSQGGRAGTKTATNFHEFSRTGWGTLTTDSQIRPDLRRKRNEVGTRNEGGKLGLKRNESIDKIFSHERAHRTQGRGAGTKTATNFHEFSRTGWWGL